MKKNYARTDAFWFLFFVTNEESYQAQDRPILEDSDFELMTSISLSDEENSEESESTESADEENDGFSESIVDPARTRGVDPARTGIVDPARTRGVDPART